MTPWVSDFVVFDSGSARLFRRLSHTPIFTEAANAWLRANRSRIASLDPWKASRCFPERKNRSWRMEETDDLKINTFYEITSEAGLVGAVKTVVGVGFQGKNSVNDWKFRNFWQFRVWQSLFWIVLTARRTCKTSCPARPSQSSNHTPPRHISPTPSESATAASNPHSKTRRRRRETRISRWARPD